MGFRIRGADSILQRLTSWVATSTEKITDFNIGSATRTLLESVALQIEEYYYDMQKAVEYAIRNAGYEAFGFERDTAKKASGVVTVSFKRPLVSDYVFAKNTQFHTGNSRNRKIMFQSSENIKVLAGTSEVNIPVECTEYGEIGNVFAGEISKMQIANPLVDFVTNRNNFFNGEDLETEIKRELRFKEFVHTLQRGTAEAVAYGIKQVPGVSGVAIDDTHIGYMYAYVHDKDGNLTPDLKANINRKIEEYRSGGIEVSVRPVVKKLVNLEIGVGYRDGIDGGIYNDLVRELVISFINSMQAAQDLNMSNLITVINDTYRDVISYINICDNPDVLVWGNEIVKAGNITVNGEGEDEVGV